MWTNIFVVALGSAGGLTLLLVLKSVIETVVFMRAGNKTEGTVIRFATTRNSDGHTMYLPVFQYRTNDGSAYEHTSSVASKPPAYEIGETAMIFYSKKNPRKAKLNSFSELWLFKLIFTLIGLTFFATSVGFFFSER
jgi:hypothetical protein